MTVGPHDRVQSPNPQPGRLIWNLETAAFADPDDNSFRLVSPM